MMITTASHLQTKLWRVVTFRSNRIPYERSAANMYQYNRVVQKQICKYLPNIAFQ